MFDSTMVPREPPRSHFGSIFGFRDTIVLPQGVKRLPCGIQMVPDGSKWRMYLTLFGRLFFGFFREVKYMWVFDSKAVPKKPPGSQFGFIFELRDTIWLPQGRQAVGYPNGFQIAPNGACT